MHLGLLIIGDNTDDRMNAIIDTKDHFDYFDLGGYWKEHLISKDGMQCSTLLKKELDLEQMKKKASTRVEHTMKFKDFGYFYPYPYIFSESFLNIENEKEKIEIFNKNIFCVHYLIKSNNEIIELKDKDNIIEFLDTILKEIDDISEDTRISIYDIHI